LPGPGTFRKSCSWRFASPSCAAGPGGPPAPTPRLRALMPGSSAPYGPAALWTTPQQAMAVPCKGWGPACAGLDRLATGDGAVVLLAYRLRHGSRLRRLRCRRVLRPRRTTCGAGPCARCARAQECSEGLSIRRARRCCSIAARNVWRLMASGVFPARSVCATCIRPGA
jgi:hypothetical protein